MFIYDSLSKKLQQAGLHVESLLYNRSDHIEILTRISKALKVDAQYKVSEGFPLGLTYKDFGGCNRTLQSLTCLSSSAS